MPAEHRLTPARRPSAVSNSTEIDQRKARRAELRQFYGLNRDDAAKGSARPTGPTSDLGMLLHPSFDAVSYCDALLAQATLPELMGKAASLAADVGDLESSRHSLVYNHHHQLFAAGDTISLLNSRTPQLLNIMTNLQQSFSEISRLAEKVAMDPGDDSRESKQSFELARLTALLAAEEPTTSLKARYHTLEQSQPDLDEVVRDAYQRVISEREAGERTP